MENKITIIGVHFYGTAKRKRKIEFQSERVGYIGNKSEILSPDEIVRYERLAWQLLDNLQYKNISKAKLVVNHGTSFQGIDSVELIPKQQILINRG